MIFAIFEKFPESAWWGDYYVPLGERLTVFRERYAGDAAAQALFQAVETEIAMYRDYAAWYGYVFYVMQLEETV